MDSFPVGGSPNPPPNVGFDQDDPVQLIGKSPLLRTETPPPDHVNVNHPPGPNVPDWLDPPPSGQDVDIAAVMVALHQAGVALRTAMHEAQQVARDAQVAAMKSEAQDIRNSALLSFGAALAAGVGQIAGGAMDIAGAADAGRIAFPGEDDATGTTGTKLTDDNEVELDELGSRRQVDDSAETDAEGPPEGPEGQLKALEKKLFDKSKHSEQQGEQEIRFKKSDIRLRVWTGLSQTAVGLGQIGAGVFELESKQQDAAEKEHEADALRAAAQSDDADNLIKNIDDLISTTRQTFSQVIEARNEAMNRITQV